ncbi:MAG: glycosyltransferase family 2 protein [Oscillospiraceae bacterium]|nr:glycosyltransferase family 2 protein [Oscillospiraceae bacterium]MDY2862651.1 glycosyltransferase family 2 protein [Oscillospiraceae bacterium]
MNSNSESPKQELIQLRAENKKLLLEKAAAEKNNRELERKISELSAALNDIQHSYNAVINSHCWKMTYPLRATLNAVKNFVLIQYFRKFCISLKRNGLKQTMHKVKKTLFPKSVYQDVIAAAVLSESDTQKQKNTVFDKNIKFSIIVPLYNTPVKFLNEMISSVIAQTYSNWELCLADGSSADHPEVEKAVNKFAQKDSRILYKKLPKNLGISGNTNACLDMASGDYIGLFDHDDLLHPAALYEAMKAICEKKADFIYTDELVFRSPDINSVVAIHFKPDYGPDFIRGINFICHFSVFSKELLEKAGRFRSEFDGSQDHDMILRLTSKAENIVHIPKILYYWRSHPNSVAGSIEAKTYAIDAGIRAVQTNLDEQGIKAKVSRCETFPTAYRIKYDILSYDKVSIIIPNKNHLDDLALCINSILTKSTYPNFEIVIVDNGSDDPELFEYYDELKKDSRFVICSLDIPFNYSKLNNFAAKKASGKYFILLNNDIEIITPEWIEEMLMYVQRDDVGICGAKLYYPDNTIQHAGVIVGLGGVAGHCFGGFNRNDNGYLCHLVCAQELSAVTAACLMIKASVFEEVNGLDEDNFKVAYNDVDLCLKVREKGLLVVWTPYAEAYHYESKSRGYEDTPEKQKRFIAEQNYFKTKWADFLKKGDPYYNPNLTVDRGDYTVK